MDTLNNPTTFTSKTLFISVVVIVSPLLVINKDAVAMPAELTKTCMAPNFFIVSATSC